MRVSRRLWLHGSGNSVTAGCQDRCSNWRPIEHDFDWSNSMKWEHRRRKKLGYAQTPRASASRASNQLKPSISGPRGSEAF